MTYLKDQREPAINFTPCMSLLKISRDKLFSRFHAKCHMVNNYLLVLLSCYVFCFILFVHVACQGNFFRPNKVEKVQKRCSHSTFSSQAIILDSFYVHVFRLLWATVACTQSILSEVDKKILINSGFVQFCQNFNMMKLDCKEIDYTTADVW